MNVSLSNSAHRHSSLIQGSVTQSPIPDAFNRLKQVHAQQGGSFLFGDPSEKSPHAHLLNYLA